MDDGGDFLFNLLVCWVVIYGIWQGILFILPYLFIIFVVSVFIGLIYLAVVAHRKDKKRAKMKNLVVPDVLYSETASNDRSYIENFLKKHGLKMRNDVTEEELRGLKLEIEKWTVTKKAMMEVERDLETLRILKVDGKLKDIELQRAEGDFSDDELERQLTRRSVEDEIKDRDRRNKIGKD